MPNQASCIPEESISQSSDDQKAYFENGYEDMSAILALGQTLGSKVTDWRPASCRWSLWHD